MSIESKIARLSSIAVKGFIVTVAVLILYGASRLGIGIQRWVHDGFHEPASASIDGQPLIGQAIILDRALSSDEIRDLYDTHHVDNDPNKCRHFMTTSCAVVHYDDDGNMIGSCVTCNQCGKNL